MNRLTEQFAVHSARSDRRGALALMVWSAAGGLLVGGPVAAQPDLHAHRVGFLAATAEKDNTSFAAFRQGLRDLGYSEGPRLVLRSRFAEGQLDRMPALVAELMGLGIDVLVAGSPAGAQAALRASKTMPIVFAGVGDPVAARIVSNLNRPGGNVTGVAIGVDARAFGGKWLELLREVMPGLGRAAVLANRANPSNSPYLDGVQAAADALRVRLDVHDAGNPGELDRALTSISAGGAQGLVVTADPFLLSSRAALVGFAARRQLPTVYPFRTFVDAGGLISYGADLDESYRRAAGYVDRILNGAKPGDLAVEQPTRFELVVHRGAARALGLRLPPSVLVRADHVIG